MLTCSQFARARRGLGWSVRQAQEASGVAMATIRRIEDPQRGPGVSKVHTVLALESAYRSAGVRFEVDGYVSIPPD